MLLTQSTLKLATCTQYYIELLRFYCRKLQISAHHSTEMELIYAPAAIHISINLKSNHIRLWNLLFPSLPLPSHLKERNKQRGPTCQHQQCMLYIYRTETAVVKMKFHG